MTPKIATHHRVELDALLDFVRPRHRMILITRRQDGTPQASPVTGGVDDDGRIVISSYPQRAKTRNARSRPEVSVVVLSDEWDDAWVQVDGHRPRSSTRPTTSSRSWSTSATSPASTRTGTSTARRCSTQGKSLLRITPGHWGPVATGGFRPSRSRPAAQ